MLPELPESNLKQQTAALLGGSEPEITKPPVVAHSKPKPRSNIAEKMVFLVLAVSLMINALIFVFYLSTLLWDRDIIDDDRRTGPSIDGVAVVVVEDEVVNPRKDWPEGQVEALGAVVKWARENAGKLSTGSPAWASLDKGQDLKEINPELSEIAGMARMPPPTVLVVKDRQVSEFSLPDNVNEALSLLKTAAE